MGSGSNRSLDKHLTSDSHGGKESWIFLVVHGRPVVSWCYVRQSACQIIFVRVCSSFFVKAIPIVKEDGIPVFPRSEGGKAIGIRGAVGIGPSIHRLVNNSNLP